MSKFKEILLKIKSFFTSKKTLSIIMASWTYCILCTQGIFQIYNIYSWLIYFLLIMIYYQTDFNTKKYKRDIIIFSIVFSLILIFGKIIYINQEVNNVSSFKEFFQSNTLLNLIGTFNLIFVILSNIIPKLCTIKLKETKKLKNKKTNKIIVFVIPFIIIFSCWLPYFLRFFPGTLSPDSFGELTTIINGFSSVSDHHPVIHILFIALPYSIGFKIFGTIKAGVALATLTQMIILASIFSSLIVFLKNRKVNNTILTIIIGYFAIVPMHGYYSIVMWKDVIFAGTLLLLTMETIKIIENISTLTYKKMISFTIVSIFCVFFRNNAIYMYIVFALISFIFFRKQYKFFLAAFIIVFGIYFLVKGPIFNYFDVKKSASSEYIGMPLQQVGRMAFKNIEFTEYEQKELNKLIPIDIMAENYNPRVSDGIKFNEHYKKEVFEKDKLKYFKIWLGLVAKHPTTALEAYATSTLGYWYPEVVYWSVANNITENPYNLDTDSKLPDKYNDYFIFAENRNTPILCIEWSIGLCFWIILLFGYVTSKRHSFKSIYPYIPIFGIWLTMMIASPVYAEFRYVYGAFTTLPLLILIPYIIKKKVR